jgi:WD40 repeat protein
MKGTGKTELCLKIGKAIQSHFDYVKWLKVINPLPVNDVVKSWIKFLSNNQKTDFPDNLDELISLLLKYLREYRCLLYLDNIESLLVTRDRNIRFREEYQGYSDLFNRLGTVPHNSCILINGRLLPRELSNLSSNYQEKVRLLNLDGLEQEECRKLLKNIEKKSELGMQFLATNIDIEQKKLIELYKGNPFALAIVGKHILEAFSGNISDFLEDTQNHLPNEEVEEILRWQFDRLGDNEQTICYWLTINREPTTYQTLEEDIDILQAIKGRIPELVVSIQNRLTHISNSVEVGVQMHPIILEYLTTRINENICKDIKSGKSFEFLNKFSLIKTNVKTYIKESQIRVFIDPIKKELDTSFNGQPNLEKHFRIVLDKLRETMPLSPGYAAGNILNILCYLNSNKLKNWDFSQLQIWQADLQGVDLHDINFVNSHFKKCSFTEYFGNVFSANLTSCGEFLIAGTANHEIRLWQISNGDLIATLRDHENWVKSTSCSLENNLLASSSTDKTVKIWDLSPIVTGEDCDHVKPKITISRNNLVRTVSISSNGNLVASSNNNSIDICNALTGDHIHTLTGHSKEVYCVSFSHDDQLLASGSEDCQVRIWSVNTGECVHTLNKHTGFVWTIAFSPDSKILASGSEDKLIHLWDVSTGLHLHELVGHTKQVRTVAFRYDDQILASAGGDCSIRLWNIGDGSLQNSISKAHSTWIRSLSFSRHSSILASGSSDQSVKLWDSDNSTLIKTFQGYTNQIRAIAFSLDGKTLASSSEDMEVRLWDIESGSMKQLPKKHTDQIRSVAFNRDSSIIATASSDYTAKLWNVSTRTVLHTLSAHKGTLWSVAFSPIENILASGSEDTKIILWNTKNGSIVKELVGHSSWVWSVIFSPDGKFIASGSSDKTIKLWDVKTGKCIITLEGYHHSSVKALAFSNDGELLASGDEDKAIMLWEVKSLMTKNNLPKPLTFPKEHEQAITSLSFTPEDYLISASDDQIIRVWNARNQCVETFDDHQSAVRSVICHSKTGMIASASDDGTIKLWDLKSKKQSKCEKTFKPLSPYENMNISNCSGLTEDQIDSLKQLGAIHDL